MAPWEQRLEGDAQAVFEFMLQEYSVGRRQPFSIAKLAERLRRSRERISAALATLLANRRVGVVGDSAENSLFYPVEQAAFIKPA